MNIVPNTTCRRCHRQYPSFRSRCPYCGTKKTKTVRTAVPETDSAVPGTPAARSAVEAVNMQMIIGAVLLLAVIVLTIVIVSANVGRDVKEAEQIQTQLEVESQTTPVPPPTATPSPSPTPARQITQVSISGEQYQRGHEYNGDTFWAHVGDADYNFTVSWYPQDVMCTPEWTSDNEEVATVEGSGAEGHIKIVGPGDATITVKVSDDPQGTGTVSVHVTG